MAQVSAMVAEPSRRYMLVREVAGGKPYYPPLDAHTRTRADGVNRNYLPQPPANRPVFLQKGLKPMPNERALAEALATEDWQDVDSFQDGGDYLERRRVPGGWLYRQTFTDAGPEPEFTARPPARCCALCFVPDVDGTG